MSTLDEILKLDEQVTDEELKESAKGNLQLADDEAKSNKTGWFKLDNNKSKLIYVPRAAKDTLDDNKIKANNGFVRYKATDPSTKKPITRTTKEAVEETEEYQALRDKYDEKEVRIDLRYYVIVHEIDEEGNISEPLTWDLAKTKYSGIFAEFITPTERVWSVKGNKDGKGLPFFKSPNAEEKQRLKKAGIKF